ncbi:MAG: hypothetical protein V4635_05570 [Bacteroidota bacterium]
MKKAAIVLSICLCFNIKAQVGKMFPIMNGTSLDDKIINMPMKNNKFTIVAIAYHRGAEEDLKKWLNPLYNMFIVKNKDGSNFDMAEIYDVNFVFVPMISGFKMIAKDFKASTDKEFWPYIMDTEKTDIKEIQKELGATDNKIPYFYVLDKSGKIVHAEKGSFSEDKMDAIQEAVN